PGFAGLGVHPPPPARTGLGPPCCRAVVRPVAASPWRAACRPLLAALGAARSRPSSVPPSCPTRPFRAACPVLSRCALSLAPGRRPLARPNPASTLRRSVGPPVALGPSRFGRQFAPSTQRR